MLSAAERHEASLLLWAETLQRRHRRPLTVAKRQKPSPLPVNTEAVGVEAEAPSADVNVEQQQQQQGQPSPQSSLTAEVTVEENGVVHAQVAPVGDRPTVVEERAPNRHNNAGTGAPQQPDTPQPQKEADTASDEHAREARGEAATATTPSAHHVDEAARGGGGGSVSTVQEQPTPSVSSSTPQTERKPEGADGSAALAVATTTVSRGLRDLMPLFETLLTGQLGPVVIDVQLLGTTSLLLHPAAFERVLDDHERASSAPLQSLLQSIQLFFVLRGEALYTADASIYPALPLLAQLLRTPRCAKVILHASLLYRLLFLYLGTDRVDLVNVVDVDVWHATLRQSAPGTGRMRLPDADPPSASTLLPALPSEVQQRVEAAMGRAAASSLTESEPHTVRHRADRVTSDEMGEVSGSEPREPVAEENEGVGGGSGGVVPRGSSLSLPGVHNGDIETDDAASPAKDAVAILSSITPLDSADSQQLQPVRRRPRGRNAGGASSANGAATFPVRVQIHRGLLQLYAYYESLLAPLEVLPAAEAAVAGTTLRDVCALRGYAVFLCAAMAHHGLFVRKDRFDEMQHDVATQTARLIRRGDACLAAVQDCIASAAPPAASPSSSAVAARGDRTAYLTQSFDQLTAQAVVDVVRAVTAATPEIATALSTDTSPGSASSSRTAGGGGAGGASRSSQGRVQHCLDVLLAVPSPAALVDSTRQAITLLQLWLALDERRSYTRTLATLFTGGCRLTIRLLSEEAEMTSAAAPSHAGLSSVPEAVQSPPPAMPPVSYSLHPHWTLHTSSTGRIFSSLPNVQTIPKQPPTASYALPTDGDDTPATLIGSVLVPLFTTHPDWTLRHLYAAPPGCVLVSCDFNQIELRVLAHLSQDPVLIAQLSSGEDVLAQVAAQVLGLRHPSQVQPWQRQAVKVMVYGLLYGMGPELLELRLAKLFNNESASSTGDVPLAAASSPSTERTGATRGAVGGENSRAAVAARPAASVTAVELMSSFYRSYPSVQGYLRFTRTRALHEKCVRTVSGVKDLFAETDPNRRKQASVALAVQGGAADILHAAMRAVHTQRHALMPFIPASPMALVMAVHDELIYAVPQSAVAFAVPFLKSTLEAQAGAMGLLVPLPVSVRVGPTLGELHTVE